MKTDLKVQENSKLVLSLCKDGQDTLIPHLLKAVSKKVLLQAICVCVANNRHSTLWIVCKEVKLTHSTDFDVCDYIANQFLTISDDDHWLNKLAQLACNIAYKPLFAAVLKNTFAFTNNKEIWFGNALNQLQTDKYGAVEAIGSRAHLIQEFAEHYFSGSWAFSHRMLCHFGQRFESFLAVFNMSKKTILLRTKKRWHFMLLRDKIIQLRISFAYLNLPTLLIIEILNIALEPFIFLATHFDIWILLQAVNSVKCRI